MRRIDVKITATINVDDNVDILYIKELVENTNEILLSIENSYGEDLEADLDNVTIDEI